MSNHSFSPAEREGKDQTATELRQDTTQTELNNKNAPEIKEIEPSGRAREVLLRLIPIGILLGGFTYWAIIGEIPNHVQGRAVILIPRSNVNIQPRQGGRVLALNVRSGDQVKKGQVLAVLEFPELETQLQDKQQKLADLKNQNQRVNTVEVDRRQLHEEAIERQRQANLVQIKALEEQLASNQAQREAYLHHLKYLNNFQNSTDQRLEAYETLVKEGALARLDFESYLFQFNKLEASNSINRVQVELDRLNGINESLRAQSLALIAQNNVLATDQRQVELQDTSSDISRYNAIADQQREINTLKTQIQTNKNVVSLYDGKILEIAVNPGEVLAAGGRIGTLEIANSNTKTNVVAMFQSGDAKRLKPGMKVEVVPDLYDRERYGGIIAKVVEVGEQPVTSAELTNLVGSNELASKLLLGRDEDDRDKPIPTNASVTEAILELQTDKNTPSGYQWTEGTGTPHPITNGTTADAHAVVEKRSLISYLNPAFRWITGVYHR
ncbi:NHLP bacteriocin system secretion protein [Chroococcus sp. FPU101]|uniref:NHLP bacteriocin system secretion protein n=1 Tax=Chroococcus sp. FPU101 TaxID=1974212 RepID=UPI001AA26880|nr:NHLP bacteriocin system secretion protein [Chroococcus sp. FPU101]GFE70512.1 secretion protein HlyD [Chroococcus sp. FPU101]